MVGSKHQESKPRHLKTQPVNLSVDGLVPMVGVQMPDELRGDLAHRRFRWEPWVTLLKIDDNLSELALRSPLVVGA